MHKRVSIFAGHYGSGKTNIAINYALMLKSEGKRTEIADLDIVNPYFRTKDSEQVLKAHGIRLISSEFASSNVDLPSLPAEAYSVIDDKSCYAVLDVGGDDRGALALGRYIPAIAEENDYEMFFVINMYRPLTRDAESTVEIMREIEQAAHMRFTSVINNSNLGDQTTADDILSSLDYAQSVGRMAGIPVKYTSVLEKFADKLDIDNILPIRIYVNQSWQREK